MLYVDKYTISWFLQIKKSHIMIALTSVMLLLFFIPLFTYIYFAADLTSKEKLMNKNDQGITLLDLQNRPFFTFYQAKYKTFASISEIPKQTKEAVIATEDKGFYRHPGFSIKSIARSVVQDFKAKGLNYGGSTLTQQLVKNSLLTSKKDFIRKYQEIVLAAEVERRFSKDEILEMYLNSVYFGNGAFGVKEAAQSYFAKDANDLDIAQSAFLAGLLEAPSYLSSPSGKLTEAVNRQHYVLSRMKEQGYISQEQLAQAENEKLDFKNDNDDIRYAAPHFALMVKDELIKMYGEETVARSGFRVKTTINLDWQKYAEEVVNTQLDKLAPDQATNAAVVVEDPKTGEIRVLVGSRSWYNDQFGKVNMAEALRSPGSSFKPIVYLSALEGNIITPATILKDQPTTFRNDPNSTDPSVAYYKPVDYDRRFRGPVTVRRALSNSLNIPAVEVMNKVGIQRTLEMAKRLGITTLGGPSDYGLSLVLGTGEVPLVEMTNAYATFANQGRENQPTTIAQIYDKTGNLIYEHTPQNELVVDPKFAFLLSSILSDNQTRAEEFGNLLTISRPAAVKTGTAEDWKDSWTLGYTPSLTIGVWVGNNDNSSMREVAGSLGAAPIWKVLMEKFLAGTAKEDFEIPDGVVAEKICPWNGLSAKDASISGTISEYFVEGTAPVGRCIAPKVEPPKQDNKPSGSSQPSPTPQHSQMSQQGVQIIQTNKLQQQSKNS